MNKLFEDRYKNSGVIKPDDWRCSGRSTAIALNTVARCIAAPGVWHPIMDHSPDKFADEHLVRIVELIAHRLELKLFLFRKGSKVFYVKCDTFDLDQPDIQEGFLPEDRV